MFQSIQRLFKLLTDDQRKKLFRLQLLVVLMAFTEVAGVASIGPFMALVGNIDQLHGDGLLGQLYSATGLKSERQFLLWLGIGVVFSLAVAAVISMYTVWRLSLYAQQIGVELSTRLYSHYMQQPWLFHASGSSSQLTSHIVQECNRITGQVIQPLLHMNAKAVMATVMATAVFLYNPVVAITGLVIFGVAYALLYQTVHLYLDRNGKAISRNNQQRLKLMNEGFGGIKDTLLLGRQVNFNQRFEFASRQVGRARGITQGLSQAPRYIMELLAFGGVIFLVLYLLTVYEGNLGLILPVLSVYALAGYKLLPAFQQIYINLAQVKGNLSAFDNLEPDLIASQDTVCNSRPQEAGRLSPKTGIRLESIHFTYPGKADKALDGLSINVPIHQVIGLVGASGSGKSTAIDILLGLIEPQMGRLMVDGHVVSGEQKRAWQNNVGFVPQSIFLADASIQENIAFGLPPEEIDDARVKRAAKIAHLDEFLEHLPEGLDTRVGERGIQLSGGQRQRIGIARALYDDAEVLVLDEATSALDGITEKLVMDAIHDFSGQKTVVIIAHRLATVKQCDCIYLMEKGRVIDQGSYHDLCVRNVLFKHMTEHA